MLEYILRDGIGRVDQDLEGMKHRGREELGERGDVGRDWGVMGTLAASCGPSRRGT